MFRLGSPVFQIFLNVKTFILSRSPTVCTTPYFLSLTTWNFYQLLKTFWFTILSYRLDYLVWHWNPSAAWSLLRLLPYFPLIPNTALFSGFTSSLSYLFIQKPGSCSSLNDDLSAIREGQVKPYVIHETFLTISSYKQLQYSLLQFVFVLNLYYLVALLKCLP